MFVKGTVGKVFDPLGKWGKWDCENWVLQPSFLSIPPIFSPFSSNFPPFFSRSGSCSYIFPLDLLMIPHFPPIFPPFPPIFLRFPPFPPHLSPFPPHFPPFPSISLQFFSIFLHFPPILLYFPPFPPFFQTPNPWFGELVRSVAVSVDACLWMQHSTQMLSCLPSFAASQARPPPT